MFAVSYTVIKSLMDVRVSCNIHSSACSFHAALAGSPCRAPVSRHLLL